MQLDEREIREFRSAMAAEIQAAMASLPEKLTEYVLRVSSEVAHEQVTLPGHVRYHSEATVDTAIHVILTEAVQARLLASPTAWTRFGEIVKTQLVSMYSQVHHAFRPNRDDAVAEWLKASRDEYRPGSLSWMTVNGLLDGYRIHADTGTPLDEEVLDDAGPH